MYDTNLMLFICLVAPLSMMLFVFRGRPRAILTFLLSGTFMCLLAGEINSVIRHYTHFTIYFLTVNITPIVEEILKAIPVIFTAFLFKPKRQHLLEFAVAVGIGFATMENISVLAGASGLVSMNLILARTFGAGMMHGVSTLAVAFSMTIVSEKDRISHAGIVAALSVAIIYHSIYNILIQSTYPILGIVLPIVTFIPLVLIMKKQLSSIQPE